MTPNKTTLARYSLPSSELHEAHKNIPAPIKESMLLRRPLSVLLGTLSAECPGTVVYYYVHHGDEFLDCSPMVRTTEAFKDVTHAVMGGHKFCFCVYGNQD